MRSTFAVGRLNRSTSELVLSSWPEAPFPGPWKLRAVVGTPGVRGKQPGAHALGRAPTPVLPFPGVEQE